MFTALLTVILHGIITSFYLRHYFLEKYGVPIIKISPDNMNMWNDSDTITSLSLLFYPVITVVLLVIFFLINKQRKELRAGLLLYILTVFLVFFYIFSFSESVMVVIAPVLMIIGALSAYRGGYHEAKRAFILMFIILILAYGADKLSVQCINLNLW
jgi:hypothetical protein